MILIQTIEYGNFNFFQNMTLPFMLFYIGFLAFTLIFVKKTLFFFLCTMIQLTLSVVAILNNCDFSSTIILVIINIIMFYMLFMKYRYSKR